MHSLTSELECNGKTRCFPGCSCHRLYLHSTFQVDGNPTTQNYVSLENGKVVVRYAPRAELRLSTGICQFKL